MLIKLEYKNHFGNVLKFGESSLYVNRHDMYDYQWDYTSSGRKVTSLSRDKVQAKTLPIVICAASLEAAAQIADNLIDFAEADTSAQKSGQIIINGYSYKCYIIGAKHSEWLPDRCYMRIDLAVISDNGSWVKELPAQPFNAPDSSITLNSGSVTINGEEIELETINEKKYPYKYPYRYTTSSVQRSITIDGINPLNCRLSIYGACVNPSITIGGNVYALEVTLAAGERIVVDGVNRTITKYAADGAASNAFDAWRNMDNYIFEPLKCGENAVFWSGAFSFYISPVIERSAPKWA